MNQNVTQEHVVQQINNEFIRFGYENKAAVCKKCYSKPARIEPRFGYAACINHFGLRPVDFD